MKTLLIFLAIMTAAFVTGVTGACLVLIDSAPLGHEDRTGFHRD